MLDLFLRACRHPIDYAGALNRRTLTFQEHRDEGSAVHSFIFSLQRPFSWHAGQHGVFTMPDRYIEGKAWRAFSIASSALEGVVQISTIIPPEPSAFKQQLLALVTGDEIVLQGPYGELHARPHRKQIVGVAGGIGITPFRAMMYEIAHDQLDVSLHLIYGGKDNHWNFHDQIAEWANHPRISIAWVQSPDEVNSAIDQATAEFKNAADYFISGSPGMIGAVAKRLKENDAERIFSDPFKGY